MISNEKLEALGYELEDGNFVLRTGEGSIVLIKDGKGLFLPKIRRNGWTTDKESWEKFFGNEYGLPCIAINDDDTLEDFTNTIFDYISKLLML